MMNWTPVLASLFSSWMHRPWIGGRALAFFNQVSGGRALCVGDFRQSLQPEARDLWQPHDVAVVCSALRERGLLTHAGDDPGKPVLGTKYVSWEKPSDALVAYGAYDFVLFGFPLIHSHFMHSVLCLEIEKSDGTRDVGTAFLALKDGECVVFTARHCVEGACRMKVWDWDLSKVPCQTIMVPEDSSIDVAMLLPASSTICPQRARFTFNHGAVLEQVMTMGYPPIPGFQSPLVAEQAAIAGHLKATVGALVAEGPTLFSPHDLVLISARVKGGNSGGPVLNARGEVIGLVTDAPMNDRGLDELGYGVVTPYALFQQCEWRVLPYIPTPL